MLRTTMTKFLLFVTSALVACGHASPPSTGGSVQAGSGLRCEPRGNVVAMGPTSADVPIVVLYERSMWLSGFDVPTLLVYADGTAVYGDEPYGKSSRLYQATLSPEGASEILRMTTDRLRDAPPSSEMTNVTDQPLVQIMFRDNDAWRVVEAYGMTRTTDETAVPAGLRNVFATYRELLNRRPSDRVPAPGDFPRPTGWPAELPTFRGQHVVDQLALCAFRRPAGN
jgi:hypothetical protein